MTGAGGYNYSCRSVRVLPALDARTKGPVSSRETERPLDRKRMVNADDILHLHARPNKCIVGLLRSCDGS